MTKQVFMRSSRSGFTMVEIMVCLGVVAVLTCLALPGLKNAHTRSLAIKSCSNLRELVQANTAYAADNGGQFCPAQDRYNNTRWHGARSSSSAAFDPHKGYLAPYLGNDGLVKKCPLFQNALGEGNSFEVSTGGYGYNAVYVGGTPASIYSGAMIPSIPNPVNTVMFTTTAFARSSGLQEYAYCEPYKFVDNQGRLLGDLQPSVHFRVNGKALVAWCDGHVTEELPSKLGGVNYYGGNNAKNKIGWFGPEENNGNWNPQSGL